MIKMYVSLHVKYPLLLSCGNETCVFWTDFLKTLKYQIRESPSGGSRIVACGRTDRHDKANSRFSQFCERA